MGPILLRLRGWWETADRTQKVVTIFGATFLTFLLVGTFYFASRPKMVLLYGGLSGPDAGMIAGEVQKMGILVESDMQGNVKVPSDKHNEVQSRLTTAGKLPASGHMGNEELSKFNAFMAPSVEAERLKAMLEGEMARTIERIDGIATARVHITLGERTAFAQDKKPASASVMLQEKSGAAIGPDQARAIALLVARGTTGLSTEHVFVVDSAGRSLFDGSQSSTLMSKANEKVAAEASEALRRERDLQTAFDASFGRGATLVKVNLVMDFDKETKKATKINPKDTPLVEETATEVVGGTKSASTASQPGGLAANLSTATGAGSGDYTGEKIRKERATDTIETQTEKAIGSITTMSVAVLVNSDKVKDTAPVKAFLDSYVKANPGAEATVTSSKFDTTATAEAQKAAAAAGSQDKMQMIFSFLPIAALIAVAVMVMKSLAKTAKAGNVLVSALPGGGFAPTGSHEAGESDASGTLKGLSLVKRERQVIGLPDIDDDYDEEINVGDLREKVNLPLEQIRKMATKRPDSVAMLIKSWMLEEAR